MKLKEIFSGWRASLFDKRTDFSRSRAAICRACPMNSKNGGSPAKLRNLLNKILPAYCRICKCVLHAKQACSICACPWGKWGPQLSKEEILKNLEK